MFMHMYIYVYLFRYIYVYLNIYIYVYIYVYLYMFVYVYIYLCINITAYATEENRMKHERIIALKGNVELREFEEEGSPVVGGLKYVSYTY
jgi:hypothetical protein